MSDKPKILVVDDEPVIRDMLDEYLSGQGYEVVTADSGESMHTAIAKQVPDLVLLDLRLPKEDGLSLARYLREHYSLGIIMVTGAGDVVDRIVGLEMGADDYIAKPFDPRELLARIKSVLRRSQGQPVKSESPPEGGRIPVGRCRLDLESHRLLDSEDREIPITTMEFGLLKIFVTRPNRVLTRDQISNLSQNREWDPFDRSIDIRITRLRRKIEVDPARPRVIKTVRGAGYMFVPDADT
jgi:two-component system, OmpR family, response regulator